MVLNYLRCIDNASLWQIEGTSFTRALGRTLLLLLGFGGASSLLLLPVYILSSKDPANLFASDEASLESEITLLLSVIF